MRAMDLPQRRKFADRTVGIRRWMPTICSALALLVCGGMPAPATPTAHQSADRALVGALNDSLYNPKAAWAAIARGASANAVDRDSGQTALMLACQFADTKLVSTLLTHGAHPNARDKRGNTALIVLAHSEGNDPHDVVATGNALLAHGARINAANDDGQTALDVADTPEIIAYACSKGADVNARDRNGKTALMFYCATTPDDGGPGVWFAAAKVVVDHGAHVNAQDKTGWTALMRLGTVDLTEQSDAVTTAKLLIAHGANVRLKNHRGKTALQIASASGFRRLAQYLKSVGG